MSSGIPEPGAVVALAEGRLHAFEVRGDDDSEIEAATQSGADESSHLRDLDDATAPPPRDQ